MSRCPQVGRPMVRCLRQAQLLQPLAGASMAAANTTVATSARRAFSGSMARRDDQEVTTMTTGAKPDTSPAYQQSPATLEGQQQPQEQQQAQQEGKKATGPPQSRKPNDTDFKRRKLDPSVTTLHWAEQVLIKKGTPPVGSRRKRVAMRLSQNIPFEQLPYQAFQEARKILQADREAKVRQIVAETARIRNLEAQDPAKLKSGEEGKQRRLKSMRDYVEKLKIMADINDPEVKRRFEDGLGDMSKPIYRHLARRKWLSYQAKLINQRIEQFHIVPDLLPKFSPSLDVQLSFRQRRYTPGEAVPSNVSERPPTLTVQAFDAGERLVTIAVVDSDVPSVEQDGFSRRCHFLAANVALDPTRTSFPLAHLTDAEKNLAVPWLPPVAQKGSPYHRLSVFVLEQAAGQVLATEGLRGLYGGREGFSIKSIRDRFRLRPVGFTLFRSVWDETTAAVMERNGIPGADVELKRVRVESMKGPRKAKGWEAKRQGPKYRHLWKYTHRIATPRRKFVR